LITTPARCQLYLAAPGDLAPNFSAILSDILDLVEVACVRLPPVFKARELVRLAQARGTAVVIDGDAEMAVALGADGAHLGELEKYGLARRRLGDSAILGVHCGRSRDRAMRAGEAGADYIAFDPDLDLVRWWAEIMVVPMVAELGEALDRASDFAAAGAEFVAAGEALWRDPAGAPAAARRLASRLA
jgi:thiamine-phosphate pyrophosphorylase